MISSEIAVTGYSAIGRLRGSKQVRPQMVNPQLLVACDSISISGNAGPEGDKNRGQGGVLLTSLPQTSAMLPPGSSRASNFSNSGSEAQITSRPQISKYANPPAVEHNGQMWHIR